MACLNVPKALQREGVGNRSSGFGRPSVQALHYVCVQGNTCKPILRLGKVSKAYRRHIKKHRAAIAAKRRLQGLPMPYTRADEVEEELKSGRHIFISIDEAGSHVDCKYFRQACWPSVQLDIWHIPRVRDHMCMRATAVYTHDTCSRTLM